MVWPVPKDAVLTGDSVELRTADPAADAAGLFAAIDDDRVWAHVPGRPADAGELEQILAARTADPGWHVWIVRSRRAIGDRPAGAILGYTSYLDARPHDAGLEIGATLYTPSVWGGVVNPEAKLLLLGYAFDTLRAGRVQLKTDTRNQRSQQAIARLGARYEGTLRRQFRRADGTVRDSVMFSIIAEDWPEVRARLENRLRAAALAETSAEPDS
ncbi:GNAT family N-acetyltransferase [Nocardia sp. 2]|uniref:GNAT family N-acetyltransferase n=2 Tax=Nocardia acididurans TaxID=2802282 RepID=A0ABS1LZS7_9NOCA|nr:GNAT family N-acetyltransferase [Nocardia acididurans]